MAKKRTADVQAKKNKNVLKSSKGKFKTAAEMQEQGRKTKAAKEKAAKDSKKAVQA